MNPDGSREGEWECEGAMILCFISQCYLVGLGDIPYIPYTGVFRHTDGFILIPGAAGVCATPQLITNQKLTIQDVPNQLYPAQDSSYAFGLLTC